MSGTAPPSPGTIRAQVDQTVVSVGPYRFHRATSRPSRRAARSGDSGSPPHSARNSGRGVQPASSSMCQVAGVACISVACDPASSAASASPSSACSRLASTTSAPTDSGRNSSSTEMSNEVVVTASRRSSASSPGARRMLSRKLTTAPLGTTTPLGRPVEPEV